MVAGKGRRRVAWPAPGHNPGLSYSHNYLVSIRIRQVNGAGETPDIIADPWPELERSRNHASDPLSGAYLDQEAAWPRMGCGAKSRALINRQHWLLFPL